MIDPTLAQLLAEVYRLTALATELEKRLAASTAERDEFAATVRELRTGEAKPDTYLHAVNR